ncbi:MAG: NFACT family protein, partial [Oscillospiraceae bacterium]|nr:NFACT family protein [Oscillospiraceae bacterium]
MRKGAARNSNYNNLRGNMALDGLTLGFIKNELTDYIIGSKVEKVHQPSKQELVLLLRTRNGAYRLYFSADGQSPRVHLTSYNFENPKTPPMLCMMIRKRLVGANLISVEQIGNDRILIFTFDGTTEIGDRTKYYIVCEIMAQKSNIIFLDENKKILDAVKRIDETKSSVREILPGLNYELPPMLEKCDLFIDSAEEITEKILLQGSKMLSKSVLDIVGGISPIVGREIAYRTVFGDKQVSNLSEIEKERLLNEIKDLISSAKSPKAYKITVADNDTFDFSFLNIRQYGTESKNTEYNSFCELVDDFYYEKDKELRVKRKAGDLFKLLSNAIERTSRKINNRRAELEKSEKRDELRIFAELLTANQYKFTQKQSSYDVENYYDNNKIITVPADPALTCQQNAQKYFKDYKKAANAEKMLHSLIAEGEQELIYLDSVLDNLSRAETEKEIGEIRQELQDGGYLKSRKNAKQKREKSLPPIEFLSSDGFRILVGRNNVQNDILTLKTAKNYDMWLHVSKQSGSHTVICSDNREISEKAILEAATIAAYHSKSASSSSVAVDYTLIKNVKKPAGAKPGKVIYETYNTVYVTPEKETVE